MKFILLSSIALLLQSFAQAQQMKTFFYFNKDQNCGVEISVEDSRITDVFVRNGVNISHHLSLETSKKVVDIDSRNGEISVDKLILQNRESLGGIEYLTMIEIFGEFQYALSAMKMEIPLMGSPVQPIMPSVLKGVLWSRQTISDQNEKEKGPLKGPFQCRDMDLISTGVSI